MSKRLSKSKRAFDYKLQHLSASESNRLNEVEQLAKELMKKYRINHHFKFGYGWKYNGKCTGISVIISLKYALNANIPVIRNTVLHEIAHAVVGVKVGHRIEWQLKAKEMGVITKRNYRK